MSPPSNQPPERLRATAFIVREVVALLFVGFWLLLFAGELITASYTVPFWFHCVGVGVMAYALGTNVAELTAYRKPSVKKAVQAERSGDPSP